MHPFFGTPRKNFEMLLCISTELHGQQQQRNRIQRIPILDGPRELNAANGWGLQDEVNPGKI